MTTMLARDRLAVAARLLGTMILLGAFTSDAALGDPTAPLARWASAAIALSTEIPFSFVYGKKPSTDLLPKWGRSRQRLAAAHGVQRDVATYTDPASGLRVSCEVRRFAGFEAVEWVLTLRNEGTADTPVLEKILPLDLSLEAAAAAEIVLHYANGSLCRPDDFAPLAHPVRANDDFVLAPVGGRSSNGRLPFFNLQWGGEGLVGAIGWSGQWELRVLRGDGRPVRLQAGQQTTHLKLHPGESIRTPRILLVHWQGDPIQGHNAMRRLIYEHYTPLLAGKKPLPPTQCNTWFPVGDDGGKANEQNQVDLLAAYAPLGIEYMVMDAGWYGTSPVWHTNVGTWVPRKDTFPRGLKPVGEAAKKAGIRFGMWFEPERVVPGTQLDKEHPAWLLQVGPGANRLLNLGLPEAQKWFIEMVSHYIDEVPLGYFRHDFNMDPLPYWQRADAPDRVGMTEIRYIEGLYRVWSELRAKYPDVMFEGCASGGRRMDLESLGHCHTYWRSDLYGNLTANQGHIYGASLYMPGNYLNIPLFSRAKEPYALRSGFGGALCLGWDPRLPDFDRALGAAQVKEFVRWRHLAVGDFYPLLPHSLDARQWIGYQFHRADLDEGAALLLRRESSPDRTVHIRLRGLRPDQTYEVLDHETARKSHKSGSELAKGLDVAVERAPGSALISYRAAGRSGGQ
jgi:alpha-galactosidase